MRDESLVSLPVVVVISGSPSGEPAGPAAASALRGAAGAAKAAPAGSAGGSMVGPAFTEDELRLPRPPGVFRQFFARHPWFVDWFLVALFVLPAAVHFVLLGVGVTHETVPVWAAIVGMVGVAGMAVALLFRRGHPFVLVGTVAASFIVVFPAFGALVLLPAVFALYAVAVYASVRAAWVSFALLVVSLAIAALAVAQGRVDMAIAGGLTIGFLMLIATLIGVNIGNRKRYVAALVDRAAQLARERDQQALLATASERARIAREMHDIVAHSLTVMVALAAGAEVTAERDPGRAADAMRQVAETGRTALTDMRVVLGVLAEPAGGGSGAPVPAAAVTVSQAAPATAPTTAVTVPPIATATAPAAAAAVGVPPAEALVAAAANAALPPASHTQQPLAPQPGHADLEPLIQSFRATGMVVHFTVSGQPATDSAVQVTVFRVLQEALTNSLRYAPNPKHVTVVLGYGAEEVSVSVMDAGPVPSGIRSLGSGRGLIGMRERVAAFGGTLVAGPVGAVRAESSWQVRATIPLTRRQVAGPGSGAVGPATASAALPQDPSGVGRGVSPGACTSGRGGAAVTAPVRILLVDDQALLRVGFRMVLEAEPGFEIVGEAADGAAGVALAVSTRPDVILMDVRMPVLNGIDATREIVARVPASKVLILTTFDLDEYAFAALRAGASGFLLKDARPTELIGAIHAVAARDAVVSPRVTKQLLTLFGAELPGSADAGGVDTPQDARASDRADQRLAALTDREREVLTAIAEGLTNSEIGALLVVSESTVKTHVGRVLQKLGARDRVQAVIIAYETGLV